MSIEATITQFYNSVRKAGEILGGYRQEIDNRQDAVMQCISSVTPMKAPERNENASLASLCDDLFSHYNKSIDAWQHSVAHYISGKEFVNQFERSLLLIVFADVKAGKSSLGNFISGYAFRDTPYAELYTAPVCYAYDHTDKSLRCGEAVELSTGCFAEDEIQATASIQYFTLLNGLTWVDTPGIHSLTSEYEELAKDYVKYADLILFLTPSNNPIKQDEVAEIQKLVQSDKPMLITISKSDTTTMSVVDGKLATVLAAKSPSDRAAQETYTAERINKIGQNSLIDQKQYISISTKIAKHALNNQDDSFFEQSNIPAFLDQIGNVISEHAIALKMKRPRDELNAVIDELLQGGDNGHFIGVYQLCENIRILLGDIERQITRMTQIESLIKSEVISELANRLYPMLFQEKNAGNLIRKEYISEKINALLSEVVSQVITEIAAREIADFQKVQIENAHIVVQADFCIKKQQIQYEVQEGRDRKRAPRGIIEHIQSWFGKEFREYSIRTVTRTREIEMGDNFNDYTRQVLNSLTPQAEMLVQNELKRIVQQHYGEMRETVQKLEIQLESIAERLTALKYHS